MNKHSLTLVLITAFAMGCGSSTQQEAEKHAAEINDAMSDSSSDSGGSTGSMPEGCYMRAVIDGQKWEANEMTPDRSHSSIIPVNGRKDGSFIQFVVGGMRENVGKPSQLGDANQITYYDGKESFYGAKQGEFTVTKMDDDFVEGTFNFKAEKDGKTVAATDGEFRIPAPLPAKADE